MGITRLSLDRIDRHITKPGKLLIIGCQNIYDNEHYGHIAHGYFENRGFRVRSIDITGCQGSEIADLRDDLHFNGEYDYVFQHGTLEHVNGNLWQPFKNLHEACRVGGIMIHENPETKSWPNHGYHWFTQNFFDSLSRGCGYETLEISSEASMGNYINGWNVCAVFRKLADSKFVTEEQFDEYDLRKQ